MKDFLKRHAKTFFLFLIGPAAGSIFAYWYFQIRPTSTSPITPPEVGVGLAISLAITFLSSVLGLTINIVENTFEIKKKIDETKNEFIEKQNEQLRSRVKIVELRGKEADKLVSEKIRDAKLVRNTYVNLAERMSRVPQAESATIKQYAQVLSDEEGHWIDVTTIQDMSFGRFKKIAPNTAKSNIRHEVFIISATTDIINFLLINKNNSPSDLFFGWIGDNGDHFRVFWTNDRAMLEVFGGYFASLQSSAVEHIDIDYQDPNRYITRADAILGRWVCVPQIRATKPSAFHTYSILDVSISKGVWKVKSEVFLTESNRRKRVIESEVAISHSGSIFFEGINRSVAGTQRSVTFGHLKLAPDYDDMLIGVYLAEDATTVNRLLACRLEGGLDEISFSAVIPIVEKIISRRDIMKSDDWDLPKHDEQAS